MGNRLFVSFWAMTQEGSGIPYFFGNYEIAMNINGMEDVELLERYLVKILNEKDVPVTSVTVMNWKTF